MLSFCPFSSTHHVRQRSGVHAALHPSPVPAVAAPLRRPANQRQRQSHRRQRSTRQPRWRRRRRQQCHISGQHQVRHHQSSCAGGEHVALAQHRRRGIDIWAGMTDARHVLRHADRKFAQARRNPEGVMNDGDGNDSGGTVLCAVRTTHYNRLDRSSQAMVRRCVCVCVEHQQ